MNLLLPSTIASRRDVARLRTEVEMYTSWANQYTLAKRRKIRYDHEQPDLSDTARLLIRAWVEAGHATTELLSELRSIENTSPSITITLAHAPTARTRAEIVQWCRQSLAPDMLVTITWSSQLLGGMIVRTDSGLHDWSYRKRLRAGKEYLIRRLAHA